MLPLSRLSLHGCIIDTAVGSAPPVPVASTWQEVEFPSQSRLAGLCATVCAEALAGYADSVAAAAQSAATGQPTLQRLVGG